MPRHKPLGFQHKKLQPVGLIFEHAVSLPGGRESVATSGSHEYNDAIMLDPKEMTAKEFREALHGYINLEGLSHQDIGVVSIGKHRWAEARHAGYIPFISKEVMARGGRLHILETAVRGAEGDNALKTYERGVKPGMSNLHLGNVVGIRDPEKRTDAVLNLMKEHVKNNG